jgi:flagellar protein FlaG
MEVGKVSQGGQANLDFSNRNTGSTKAASNVSGDKANGDVVKLQLSKGNNSDYTKEDVQKAVDKLNKVLEDENIQAVYEVHEVFKRDVMIKIVNNNTKEVLLEIPPKKILDMVANMIELVGLLLDKKA